MRGPDSGEEKRMEVRICNHPGCSCPVTGNEDFCCDGCREAAADVARANTCDCEHPHCAPHD